MNLLKEHVYTVCQVISKCLEYLDKQVTRTTEAQNNGLIEASNRLNWNILKLNRVDESAMCV